MNSNLKILAKNFVRPFFRENAGALFLFYTVMLFAVGRLKMAGTVEYHYSLIMGTLLNPVLFILVCIGWATYQLKCINFIVRKTGSRESLFLYIFNQLSYQKRFRLCMLVMTILFLPIGWYGLLMTAVAIYKQFFLSAAILAFVLVTLCVVPGWIMLRKLQYPGLKLYSRSTTGNLISGYKGVLIRFVLAEQKTLFITIKVFTCSILYGFAVINSTEYYEPYFPFLFFSFGIFANGVIIHRMRNFEEIYMSLYRAEAIPLIKRYTDYLLIYAMILVPEFLTILALMPVHLHPAEALSYVSGALTITLLLNSICLLEDFSMKSYLWVVLVIFCVEYFFVLSGSMLIMAGLFFGLSVLIFFTNYYAFEKRPVIRS